LGRAIGDRPLDGVVRGLQRAFDRQQQHDTSQGRNAQRHQRFDERKAAVDARRSEWRIEHCRAARET
jgi:hypothetical protein